MLYPYWNTSEYKIVCLHPQSLVLKQEKHTTTANLVSCIATCFPMRKFLLQNTSQLVIRLRYAELAKLPASYREVLRGSFHSPCNIMTGKVFGCHALGNFWLFATRPGIVWECRSRSSEAAAPHSLPLTNYKYSLQTT
jgi:hypothetical protein